MNNNISVSKCKHCDLGVIRVGLGKWWHGELHSNTINLLLGSDEKIKELINVFLNKISATTIPLEKLIALEELTKSGILSTDTILQLSLISIPYNNRSCKSAHYGKVPDSQWMGDPRWSGKVKKAATPTRNEVYTY